MLLAGVLALLNLRSLRHTDQGIRPHFPLKQHQDREADLSSLLLPFYSRRRIAPEQYFSGFRNNEHKYEVFLFWLWEFHSCPKLRRWPAVNHLSANKQNEKLLTRKYSAGRERVQIHSWCYIIKIQSPKCVLSWIKFLQQYREGHRGIIWKCKGLKGMSILWHEDHTPELPFLTVSAP